MAEPEYEERYCAFVDILGFKELVGAVERGSLPFTELRDLLRFVHSAGANRAYTPQIGFHAADIRYQSISDAICISAASRAAGLLHLFWSLQHLSMMLLHKGYFARGAVVKGRIYHDDVNVFGDALIRAYNLEQNIVRFPRIMLTRDVALDANAYADNEAYVKEFGNTVGQASDGPHYFHALRGLMILHDQNIEERTRRTLTERFNETADLIQKRFDEAADNPQHFEKVQWFAEYWNDSISTLPQLKRIFGPGLTPPPLPGPVVLNP